MIHAYLMIHKHLMIDAHPHDPRLILRCCFQNTSIVCLCWWHVRLRFAISFVLETVFMLVAVRYGEKHMLKSRLNNTPSWWVGNTYRALTVWL
jgi:hypothetical protein